MIVWAANNWAWVSIYLKRHGTSLDELTTREYLSWVTSAMMEGCDHPQREQITEYLYAVPEIQPARDLDSWGTGTEAEELTRKMMLEGGAQLREHTQ